jgi:hypothetical protein
MILALCATSLAGPVTFTLAGVEGAWSNVIGGEWTVQFSYDQWVSYGNHQEDRVGWGYPVYGSQTVLGFTGAVPPPAPVNVGDPFVVGQLRHGNAEVGLPVASALDLTVSLGFSSPAPMSQGFTFTLFVDESLNPAADTIYFPTSFAPETFDIGGVSYTLELLGFGSTPLTLVDNVQTPEWSTTSTLLWGKITPVAVPAPGAPLLAALGASLVGWLGRRRILR